MQGPSKKFGEYEIHSGDAPLVDVPTILNRSGVLKDSTIPEVEYTPTIQDEEKGLSEFDPQSSIAFEKNRRQVRGALSAIVKSTFEEFGVSRENGCDFGCGSTGEMVEELLCGYVSPSSWAQVDVNPESVGENKRRHPGSTIVQGSYLHVKETCGLKETLDTATGLSSLDATVFIEHAVREIRSALKVGGFFVHVQDVRPGPGGCFREMMQRGFNPPYFVRQFKANTQSPFFQFFVPETQGLGGQWVSTGDIFRSHIGRAIRQDPRFELLANHWVTARRRLPRGEAGKLYYLNTLLTGHIPFEEASAVVTVARKVAN